MVEVAGDADGEDEHARVEQVDGGLWQAGREVQGIDHGDGAEQVAGGDHERRVQWHASTVPVDEQYLKRPK